MVVLVPHANRPMHTVEEAAVQVAEVGRGSMLRGVEEEESLTLFQGQRHAHLALHSLFLEAVNTIKQDIFRHGTFSKHNAKKSPAEPRTKYDLAPNVQKEIPTLQPSILKNAIILLLISMLFLFGCCVVFACAA